MKLKHIDNFKKHKIYSASEWLLNVYFIYIKNKWYFIHRQSTTTNSNWFIGAEPNDNVNNKLNHWLRGQKLTRILKKNKLK